MRCYGELGLDPNKTTVIMMSGGAGIGELDLLAGRLLQLDTEFQLVALAGKNKKLLSALEALARRYKRKLFPLPFTRTIEQRAIWRLQSRAD